MESDQIRQLCDAFNGSYFFYGKKLSEEAIIVTNRDLAARFQTASVIKVPILLAWIEAEREGLVSSSELCDLDKEEKVEGAGFSFLMKTRRLAFADVLLMMIATSDNACTNAVISRLGFDYLNRTCSEKFRLNGTHLGRKMMSKPQPEKGLDNWTTGADMIRCYELIHALSPAEKGFLTEKLRVCQASDLFLRDIRGDGVTFYHKTGGLWNVMNDWGFTEKRQLFLLVNDFNDYQKVYEAFGKIGKAFLVGD